MQTARLAALALAMVGCGGQLAPDYVGDGGDVCEALGLIPQGRASYPIGDGGIAYVCCGYSAASLARLIAGGDTIAPHCAKASTCGGLGEACCQVATPSDGPWLWACADGVQGIIDQADDAATSCGCESACDGAGQPICFPPEPRGFVGQ